MTNSLLPTGFRDRLPPEADASARLVRAILDTAACYGYERVQAPLAEYEASLTGSLGTSARDLLRFVDPVSGETMAVRSDITGQVGRIASTRMGHHPRPVRLSYAGPVLKLRASQLSPERELHQRRPHPGRHRTTQHLTCPRWRGRVGRQHHRGRRFGEQLRHRGHVRQPGPRPADTKHAELREPRHHRQLRGRSHRRFHRLGRILHLLTERSAGDHRRTGLLCSVRRRQPGIHADHAHPRA